MEKKLSLLTAGEACEVEEHQDSVFSPLLFSFVLWVLMTFHQHETPGRSCHSRCQISQNSSDTPAAAGVQSLWWESALRLQTHISNLDTCARCLIFPLTVEWKKVLSVGGGKPRCTPSLISHGGALTDAPELKRLDKLCAPYWLNGGSHSGLSAPIKELNTPWRFSHLQWLEGDCSVLPTGDRKRSLQDVESPEFKGLRSSTVGETQE